MGGSVQGVGLGHYLMALLEDIAHSTCMEKVMLTVLKCSVRPSRKPISPLIRTRQYARPPFLQGKTRVCVPAHISLACRLLLSLAIKWTTFLQWTHAMRF